MAKLTREDIDRIIKAAQGQGKKPNFKGMDFTGLPLLGAKLDFADLSGANLKGVNLKEASLEEVNLSGANLVGAKMELVDLYNANLHSVDLEKADLSKAVLEGADLTRANLSKANLYEAILKGTNLTHAKLVGTNLFETDFDGASLFQSSLMGANFFGANLNNVDFSRAILVNTIFLDTDLSTVIGLETTEHLGPSYIDTLTLARSKGKIPEVFLREAGVPEVFITYFPSLTGEAVQYYSCFISYSSKDEAFAQRLHADLQQKSVRCWFAPEDMKIGDKIRPRIDESIRVHDKLLIVLSENSISSPWVEKEVGTAFEEEGKRGKTVLFPVRLDEAVMQTNQAWAADIRRGRHIGDFSRWKDHDAYQQAFERLLRDLKAEG